MHNEQFNLENADFIRFFVFALFAALFMCYSCLRSRQCQGAACPGWPTDSGVLQLYTHLPKDNVALPAIS